MMILIKKLFKIFVTLIGLFIGGYTAFVLVILLWQPPTNLPKHEYDGIIVLTGAKGRIETGFELLLEEVAPRLLISGVENEIDFNSLVAANSEKLAPGQNHIILNHCCINLDYIANTTETNAIESKKWIINNKLNNIIIVTSAVHMPRSYLQFRAHTNNDIAINAYSYFRLRRFDMIQDEKFWYNSAKEYLKFYGSLIQIAKA